MAACCVPIENFLTTNKVKGTDEMNGCCCCLDLRTGLLVMSIIFGLTDFFVSFGVELYTVIDMGGFGIPEGYPPDFPSMTVFAVEEVVLMLLGLAGAGSCGVAFLRALKHELGEMRTIFRVNAVVTIIGSLVVLIVQPFIFFPQACTELESGHRAACSPMINSTDCLAVENPMLRMTEEPRCQWTAGQLPAPCEPCDGCTKVACEVGGISVTMISGVIALGWRVYFLFVLNAYIMRHDSNETTNDSRKAAAGMFSTTANPVDAANTGSHSAAKGGEKQPEPEPEPEEGDDKDEEEGEEKD